MKTLHIFLVLGFIVLYSLFVFLVDINIELDIASELMVASAFFFALFSGFFIARQNDRYNEVVSVIAERDGLFSYIYRITGLVPRMQSEVKKIIRQYYDKILEKDDWSYNEFNPSTTLSDLTGVIGSVTDEESAKIANNSFYDGIWDTILQLQGLRKKVIALRHERLLFSQWVLIYVFAALVLVSFHFMQTEYLFVDILKIIFGTAVFFVIILIKQLNDLSLFGKDFSKSIAKDVLRIIDEVDREDK